MIIDNIWEFSDDQDIAASTLSSGSTVISEDVVDLNATQQDGFFATVTTTRIGEQAKPPVLVVTVGAEAFTGAAAAVDVKLTSKASSATISSGGTVHATIQIPALSAIGYQAVLPLPWAAYNRYLGIQYTANGGNLTAGYINAHIVEAGELHD